MTVAAGGSRALRSGPGRRSADGERPADERATLAHLAAYGVPVIPQLVAHGADAAMRIGEAALTLEPDLAALEVNPLFVRGDAIEALDALAVFSA